MSYAVEHEGKAYTPNGRINVTNVSDHNREAEAKEIAWLKTAPDKCMLYVSMPRPIPAGPNDTTGSNPIQPLSGTKINTWLGTEIATNVIVGFKSRIGFGYHSYRRSISCKLFGVLYHGWYMQSSGDYCRLKKAKKQN